MFGYVTANRKDLAPEQETRYRAAYCGLCDALRRRHGIFARFALSYDMAFLVLLLDSLYEPERTARAARCAMHPFCARRHEQSAFTNYAADMTIALYYHKCLDDWRDERNPVRRTEASLLRRRYDSIASAWPGQCAAIGAALARLSALERDENASADAAAACFGAVTAAVFAPREDIWAPRLRAFGMALGRFIYVMDAWDDCEKDLRRGSFNPLKAECGTPDFDLRCREILEVLMGECAGEFEKLPLVEDIGLMRNVIYSGVWTRFEMKRAKRAHERRRSDADNRSV